MNRLLTIALAALVTSTASLATAQDRPFRFLGSGGYIGFGEIDSTGQGLHLGNSLAGMGLRGLSPDDFFRDYLPLNADDPSARQAYAYLIAADGSQLIGIAKYEADALDEESLTATTRITIIGGTGRFAHALGTIDAWLMFADESLLNCLVLTEGTINY